MKKKGKFIEKKDHPMRIARCSRSGDILEPIIKPQWYIRTKELASMSIQLVKDKKIEILPQEYEQDWFRWLG